MRAPRTFIKWGCAAIAGMVMTGPVASASAQQTQPQPSQDRKEHVVRSGDTLWDLARQYLANPYLWPVIYEANRQVVENPHRIYPRERLIIPPLPGETVVVQDAVEVVAQPQGVSTQQPRTRFYAPTDTTTGPTLITGGNAIARRVHPGEYYAAPFLSDTASLGVLGQVYRSADARTNKDNKLGHTFHPYESMYVSYAGAQRPNVGDQLLAVRIERDVTGYGRVVVPNGVIVVDSLTPSVMRATVTRQFGNLRTGDLLIPMDSFPENAAVPVPLENGPRGVVLEFVEPQPLYGTTEHAFVNLGAASGLKVGDELTAYLPQRRIDNDSRETIPQESIATMVVVKTGTRTSTVRVTRLQQAVLDRGIAVQLVRRMP